MYKETVRSRFEARKYIFAQRGSMTGTSGEVRMKNDNERRDDEG